MEIIVLLYACGLILMHLHEIYVQRGQYIHTLLSNPTRILFFAALLLILIIVPLRVTCNTQGEDILVVLIIIFISMNWLYFARQVFLKPLKPLNYKLNFEKKTKNRGFKFITTFVYKFHMILRNNVTRFFLIYSIFLLGFSQSKMK